MTVKEKNNGIKGMSTNGRDVVMVKIDGEKLHKAVLESPFTLKQICSYINKGSTAINDAHRRNVINEKDLIGICKLIGKKPEIFYAKIDVAPKLPELKAEKSPRIETPKVEPKLSAEKPMTAREDPSQNWLVNIYRAIEDQTDRVDIQVSKASDNIAAIRGLREAIIQQTEMLREIREMLR